MTRIREVTQVQITLAEGKVLDFQKELGDKISLDRVNTAIHKDPESGTPEILIEYYRILIVPKEDVPDGYRRG